MLRLARRFAAHVPGKLRPRRAAAGDHALRCFAGAPSAAESIDGEAAPRVVGVTQLSSSGSGGGRVAFSFSDGSEFAPSARWVRDHCQCPKCVDSGTLQRLVDYAPLLLLPADAHVIDAHTIDDNAVAVQWTDAGPAAARVPADETHADLTTPPCTRNVFPHEWLWRAHQEVRRARPRDPAAVAVATAAASPGAAMFAEGVQPWLAAEYAAIDSQQLRGRLQFADLGEAAAQGTDRQKDAVYELLSQLERYGLAFIEGVPPTLDGTEAMVRSFGVPRPTIWGGMWGTTVDLHEAGRAVDFAYSDLALTPHIDCCYLQDVPGYQVLNCAQRVDVVGGESTFLDGFRMAGVLREEAPDTFAYFAATPLRYYTRHEDVDVEAVGETFTLHPIDGTLRKIRYNEQDRCPITFMTEGDADEFYDHLSVLVEVLRRKALLFETSMPEGTAVIFDNQRVFHGRNAFTGVTRSMLGCYIGKDDGLNRKRVLDAERSQAQQQGR